MARLDVVGPAAGAMVDAGNLDTRAAHAIRNDVGRFRYHQLAGAGNAARRPELGVFRQQFFDAVENVQGDPFCGGGVVFGNLGA